MNFINKLKKRLVRIEKEKVLIPCIEGHYLDGRYAFITGGASGIGFSIAEAFLKNGAHVLISGRNEERLLKAKKSLIAELHVPSDRIKIAIIDITDISNLQNYLYQILDSLGWTVDIFVNNAGVNGGNLFPDTSEEDYDRILDTNLKGMYFFSQAILKYMVKNHIKGNILNITSSSALRPAISPYIISKWGERGLTLGLAKKYLPYGIIVNGLAPGSTLTPMLSLEDNMHFEDAPVKRYLAPEEIGNMAVIMVSSIGKMIIGDTVYMTGGAGVITFDDTKY